MKQYRDGETCLVYDDSMIHYSFKDLRGLDEAVKSRFKIVMGHFTYGMPAPFFSSDRSFRYATFMRDPIRRMLSLYNHLSNFQFNGQAIVVKDFLDAKHPRCREFDNHQTRIISGMKAEFGKCSAAMLNSAKKHLLNDFALIGITEYFDESLYLAKEAFGWKPVPHLYMNSGRKMPKQYAEAMNEENIDLLRSHNALDIKLYEFALELFREKLRSSGGRWEARLERFKLQLAVQRQKNIVIRGAGCIENITPTHIMGWAKIWRSDEAAQVKITINSRHEFIIPALDGRNDLKRRHIHPTGNCGFKLEVPDRLKLKPGDTISVSVVGDSNDLTNSPQIFQDGTADGSCIPKNMNITERAIGGISD